jgi:hypothetical protein
VKRKTKRKEDFTKENKEREEVVKLASVRK